MRINDTFLKYLGIVLLFLSCTKAPVKREVVDIEHFPMNFKVGEFYSTMKSAAKDTLYENASGDRFTGTPFAFQYIMPKFTKDTLAYFGKMNFESIEMVENLKGEFMSLFAFNESKGKENFQQLLSYMESKYGKAKMAEGYNFSQFFTYTWNLKDRELVLLVIGKEDDYISSWLGIKTGAEHQPKDPTKLPVLITNVFVFNKKFDKSLTISKVKSGDFLHLEPESFSSMYLETRH